MNIVYPAICHFEDDGYWCEFPDLNGCFSQGDTELEIVENAKEALEGYAVSVLEKGGPLPKASRITDIKTSGKDFATYIECDVSSTGKSVRQFQPDLAGSLDKQNRTSFNWLALSCPACFLGRLFYFFPFVFSPP